MTHSGTFLTACSQEQVFELLATPGRFAPLLPGYEGVVIHDESHFTLRTAIALAKIQGHVNLRMELQDLERPTRATYRGEGTVADSQLRLGLQFGIAPVEGMTEVSWRGEFTIDGMLASMVAGLIEPMGREHFERMVERLQEGLRATDAPVELQRRTETEV